MSATVFRPAYRFSVLEDGSGNSLPAITLAPTEGTVQTLANHKLIFRQRRDGFVLYSQHDEQSGAGRKAPVIKPTLLVFSISSSDPDFLKKYHPDLDDSTGPNILLTNRSANGSAKGSGSVAKGATVEADDATRIAGRLLNVRADLTSAMPPVSVSVETFYTPTKVVADVAVTAISGAAKAAVTIDLSSDPARRFTTAQKPPGSPKTSIYVDDELAGKGVFGVLELMLDAFADPDPAEGRAFFAHFRRRS